MRSLAALRAVDVVVRLIEMMFHLARLARSTRVVVLDAENCRELITAPAIGKFGFAFSWIRRHIVPARYLA